MNRMLVALLLSLLLPGGVQAHKASDSFLFWDGSNEEVPGRLDIALVDLARVVSLEGDSAGLVRWDQVVGRQTEIIDYLQSRMQVYASDQACVLNWRIAGLTQHSDGNYLAMHFRPDCAISSATQLTYSLFFDRDPLHRALVMTRFAGDEQLSVLGPARPDLNLSLRLSSWETARIFLWEGMVHLWIGYDHILFLLALMLPAAVRRMDGRWVVANSISGAVKDVAWIVTAFTLAHSITLAIATLGWVRLHIEWVESIIALSIVVAAINVVWPFLGERRYLLGFGFGLIHGFGFASVLSDVLISTSSLLLALASFNVGVELAQLAIVVLFVPLIFMLRHQWVYRQVILPVGVVTIALTGLYWVWERIPLA